MDLEEGGWAAADSDSEAAGWEAADSDSEEAGLEEAGEKERRSSARQWYRRSLRNEE